MEDGKNAEMRFQLEEKRSGIRIMHHDRPIKEKHLLRPKSSRLNPRIDNWCNYILIFFL